MGLDLEIKSEDVLRIIQKRVDEAVAAEFDLAMKRLEQRKNEIVSGILIGLMKTINIETRMNNLLVTVKEIKS